MRSVIRRYPFLLAAVVTMMFLAAGQAFGQGKVRLRVNLPVGSSWTFSQNQEMVMDSTVKAAGQQQQMQQKMSQTMSGSAEVLEADAQGHPTAMRLTFDKDCAGSMDQGGQKMPMPMPLAGQVVTVRKVDGKVSHDFRGQLDSQTEQELKDLLEQNQAMLPADEVGVGDSWSPDYKIIAEKWQIDPMSSKIGVSMTLKGFDSVAGRRAAVVEASIDVAGDMQGMSGTRSIKGTTLIDLQTGQALSTTADGNVSFSGMKEQKAPNGDVIVMDIQGTGTVKMSSKTTFKSSAGGNPPVIGGINGPMPAPQPQGGTVSPLSGTYKSDRLTLQFTPSGATGARVDITLGGQQFAGVVKQWDGTSFSGTFKTADGSEFEFHGTRTGSDMTFVSGNSTYQLTGQSAARNPFAQ